MAKKRRKVAGVGVPSGRGRSGWSRRWRPHVAEALRGLAVFLAVLAALVALYAWQNKSGPMVMLSEFTAVATAWFLNLFGEHTSVQGTHIISSRFTMRIIAECTAASPFIIYLAALVAFPSRLRAKGAGLLAGAAGLFTINLARTVSLYYVGAVFPDLLEFTHLVLWQTLIVILAVILWLFWAKRAASHVPG